MTHPSLDDLKEIFLEEAHTYFGDLLDALDSTSSAKVKALAARTLSMYSAALQEDDQLFLQSAPNMVLSLAKSYGIKLKANASRAFHDRALIITNILLKIALGAIK